MIVFLFGICVALWGWGYRWKVRSRGETRAAPPSQLVVSNAPPAVPAFEITYKQGRKTVVELVYAATESAALVVVAKRNIRNVVSVVAK